MEKIIFQLLIIVAITFQSINIANAQDVPPPPPGGHDLNGNQEKENGAPIGSGLLILLGLASGYGVKKIYDIKKKKLID